MDNLKRRIGICPICKQSNTKGRVLSTKEANTVGTPCDHCLKGLLQRNPASIVCNKCGNEAAKVDPGVTGNGFIFHPGQVYHVATCTKCSNTPSTFEEVIEMVNYIKNNKENK